MGMVSFYSEIGMTSGSLASEALVDFESSASEGVRGWNNLDSEAAASEGVSGWSSLTSEALLACESSASEGVRGWNHF